jgi:CRP-like cAMP-binding protein
MKIQSLNLKDGDVLFVEGQVIDELFVIKSGEIGIYKQKGERLESFRNLPQGSLVGEVAIFKGDKVRGATALATKDSEIIRIPKDFILKVISVRPDWVGEVMEDITNDLILTGKIMREQSIFQDDMTREYKILSPEDEGRYLNSIDDYRKLMGIG